MHCQHPNPPLLPPDHAHVYWEKSHHWNVDRWRADQEVILPGPLPWHLIWRTPEAAKHHRNDQWYWWWRLVLDPGQPCPDPASRLIRQEHIYVFWSLLTFNPWYFSTFIIWIRTNILIVAKVHKFFIYILMSRNYMDIWSQRSIIIRDLQGTSQRLH
jgi:hypothetical protein